MATCKSMANIDCILQTSVQSSSPLRKKSAQKVLSQTLLENNDEAERLARRHEINTSIVTSTKLCGRDKRRSLGLGFLAQMPTPEIAERMSHCIKLNAENKISAKNAFNLEIIDFMTYMIKKQDVNMSNLQVASTSLDVSTKIYGFRVDGIHTEILKMIGGMDKQGNEDENVIKDSEIPIKEMDGENCLEGQMKKKKKKNKKLIFSSVNALKGTVEVTRPLLTLMGDDDTQTTDFLCQARLPNHANSGFYLYQCDDVIVDTIQPRKAQNMDARISIPNVEDFSHLEICKSFSNFEFHDWIGDNELHEEQPQQSNQNRFQFDLDASLPCEHEPTNFNVNFLDTDSDNDDIGRCVQSSKQVQNIQDLRKMVTVSGSGKVSEYSFVQKNIGNHWAGPHHWKITNLRRCLGSSNVIETCHQAPAKKKKEIEILYGNEIDKTVLNKFSQSQFVRLQAKSTKTDWNEEQLTLPRDMRYSISNATRLYLHALIIVSDENDQLNTTHLSDILENYNYNNDNDTSNYCPDVINENHLSSEEYNGDNGDPEFENDNALESEVNFDGNNLVAAPKLTNKVSIAYSLKAKKIDMRQLKKSIWRCLVSTSNNKDMNIREAVEQETATKMLQDKRFSEVYKTLPNMLTKTNADALSFPISFVSLLHLANEKVLKINHLPDMSDIVVEAN